MEDKKSKIVKEMLETEKNYVRDLEIVIQTYLQPLRKAQVISPEELKKIFLNIEDVKAVNKEILEELELNEEKISIQSLSNIFLLKAEQLKVYADYCRNYVTALTMIGKISDKHPSASIFLETCRKNSRGLTLVDFLIKPVQRICKYPLFFNELLKCTPDGHEDYKNLERALKTAEALATYANESKRKAENLEKMIHIRERVQSLPKDFIFFHPNRVFICEGQVQRKVEGKVKETYIFLFNDIIVYCKVIKKPKKDQAPYEWRGYFEIENATVSASTELSFEISTSPSKGTVKQFTFLTKVREDNILWLKKIKGILHAQEMAVEEWIQSLKKIESNKDMSSGIDRQSSFSSVSSTESLKEADS